MLNKREKKLTQELTQEAVEELTQEAVEDYENSMKFYGDKGVCSCNIHSPCEYCLHPGNPASLNENNNF